MELEIYEAFIGVGVPNEKAKAVVESINKEIDRRYNLHAAQLATKGDIAAVRADPAEAKAEIIKWTVGAMFGAVALFATITKLWH
ncbi:MAG: hypothetical protein FWC58_03630 [Desulfobulbus sp.]|nr:hypothetical protein [Desulfobulbus sp.]